MLSQFRFAFLMLLHALAYVPSAMALLKKCQIIVVNCCLLKSDGMLSVSSFFMHFNLLALERGGRAHPTGLHLRRATSNWFYIIYKELHVLSMIISILDSRQPLCPCTVKEGSSFAIIDSLHSTHARLQVLFYVCLHRCRGRIAYIVSVLTLCRSFRHHS